MTTYSGKNVFLSLSINPQTFVFSSATQSFTFSMTINGTIFSQTASVNDVAPINSFPSLPTLISDNEGTSPISVPNLCPT